MKPGLSFCSAALLFVLPAWAQPPQMPVRPIVSPEVHEDRSVTFRFRDPNAKEVLFAREGTQRVAMQKGEDGVWT